MTQLELLKKLEQMVAFQTNCLRDGNLRDFEVAENEIKKLEEVILGRFENVEAN